MISPNNQSTAQNPVGRFMVAVGAVIEYQNSGLILIVQRHPSLDWHPNEWEIIYGRIDQFEDTYQGLAREIREEIGLTDLEVGEILSTWHIFRGEPTAENELIGITYQAKTQTKNIKLSAEHAHFRWVTPEEALKLVKVEGIQRDIKLFQAKKNL